MGAAAEEEEEAKRRLQKDVDFWICDNKRQLNDAAISKLRAMSPADQRRVIGGGPLEIWKDLGLLFRTRASAGRERERELAERKGVDAGKFARDASKEELQTWLSANQEYVDNTALREFEALEPPDQWRVISEGPLRECVDAAYALEQRAKHSSELATEVVEIFQKRQQQHQQKDTAKAAAPAPPVVAPHVSAMMQDVYTRYVGPEVPAHQRRCGGFGKAPEPLPPPLVGSTKGVGGVVEVLKQKYGCSKGQRLKVVGDNGGPAGIWLLESDKSVPKTHWKEGGWKWVLELEPAAPSRPAEPAVASAEAPGKKADEAEKETPKSSDDEAEDKAKSHRGRRKSRRKDGTSASSDSSPPKKAKVKDGRRRRRRSRKRRRRSRSSSEADASSRCSRESTRGSSRGRGRKSRRRSDCGQRRRK